MIHDWYNDPPDYPDPPTLHCCHCHAFLREKPDEVWTTEEPYPDFMEKEVAIKRGFKIVREVPDDHELGLIGFADVEIPMTCVHRAHQCRRCGEFTEFAEI
jgi:hypothetical protein